jgi:NAD(P)-dependent dehydrogenase (short-subunit alcohol dehydrogenase family)
MERNASLNAGGRGGPFPNAAGRWKSAGDEPSPPRRTQHRPRHHRGQTVSVDERKMNTRRAVLAEECVATKAAADPFHLDGETAFITGGGTGLGLAIAQAMVRAGARVILAGRRGSVLKVAAEAIGQEAGYFPYDVTRLGEAARVVGKLETRFGPVSILVNNAGIHLKKRAIETSEEEFADVLKTHVLGAHALTRALLPGMLERRHGSILFVASMASLFGIPNVFAYSAAKSALVGMVRALATEASPSGVRVNAIAPGWIETEMTRKVMSGDLARRQRILSRTPLGRFGEPEDVGAAAVYLCSRAANFVTGTVLPVDGGVSIGF